MIKAEFKDAIGIFQNAVDLTTCDKIIEHFQLVKNNELTLSRQQLNSDINKMQKDTLNYFLEDRKFNSEIEDTVISRADSWILNQFKQSVWECYNIYSEKFGVIDTLARHALSNSVKIQRSLPGEGYHMWHCESDSISTSNRMALVLLYLNDVTEGGETEFLYQALRVKPTKGTVIICPSGFTHTHRGNPPLNGEKYIITTWVEFIE
jgi:hypothetical protein